ncbi:cobalamin-binding protein [Magnetococcales bacterium HHB-1]
MNLFFKWIVVLPLLIPSLSSAAVQTEDALLRTVTLPEKAMRIISLAPHVTEMLFAIGAGERIIGAVNYSDYPPEAKKIPQVGGYHRLDLEKIYALKPDLIIAWSGGNEKHQVDTLQKLGFTLFISEPHRVRDVFHEMTQMARLTGTKEIADRVVKQLKTRWQMLHQRYAHKKPVRVFYQLWNRPLMTINRDHLIRDLIHQCGGVNVFDHLNSLIPKIGVEAVIQANPDVIIASGMNESRPDWLDHWRGWRTLTAVKGSHLYFIPPDLIQRHAPRVLQGAERMCKILERFREKARYEEP